MCLRIHVCDAEQPFQVDDVMLNNCNHLLITLDLACLPNQVQLAQVPGGLLPVQAAVIPPDFRKPN